MTDYPSGVVADYYFEDYPPPFTLNLGSGTSGRPNATVVWYADASQVTGYFIGTYGGVPVDGIWGFGGARGGIGVLGTAAQDGKGTGVVGDSPSSGVGVRGTSQAGAGGSFQSQTGPGVTGSSQDERGGTFQSTNAAQLRLVPSNVPLDEKSPLMQSGKVGDLYLFSVAQEVGTTGTFDVNTMLWLCIAPAAGGVRALWAQVQLGDTVGGG
jgi:hypothetical protein